MKRPDLATVPSFYHKYIQLVPGDDLNQLLQQNEAEMAEILSKIPEDKWTYRYAAGKWSIKELVQHVIDTERIFSYRALCIARGETASLPGFDETTYAAASDADVRSKHSLLAELGAVQRATTLLFGSFSEAHLDRSGVANNNPVSVRTIGFLTVGHMLHHKKILQEKYGM
jgi:uncharacterized damage-inducible protein DinB